MIGSKELERERTKTVRTRCAFESTHHAFRKSISLFGPMRSARGRSAARLSCHGVNFDAEV
ncbi:hypothetical protein CN151_01150 [Sinorhizobium meliloti]|uniref:Uncharacterized protein n=1 Tax=Sinorhizobium meliloti (strain SM11) TaxID=707241 RepID=F7XHS0_SINMM|nr:hypothetical protein SM11_pD1264 [Sinorhizobium meliloti SM11]ARS69023.1 hypothetical protein SMRU11_18465 [Sinorhizobium meliloti RU11/001]ASJ62735.1 hypothetical protein SMB554_27045 [Sinorhizobium meliloti]ASP56101.1 hypothetical protein CDO31_33015 [Sinorhizobium meliloti]ASP61917.1 hypothetical protein CDO30_27180 [Sinorhizobium meliloti]